MRPEEKRDVRMSLVVGARSFHRAHGARQPRSSQSGPSVPHGAEPGTITVATFNCENVFVGPPEPGHTSHDQPPKSAAAIAAAARVIVDTGADVIALQEVHDKKALDALTGQMKGNPYPYQVLVPGNDHRGINVAVLSKYPVTQVVSNASDRFEVDGHQDGFCRDFLEATVKVSDHFEFTLGTTHLKAQAGGQAADHKRLAEGREIHRIVADELARYPGRNYVVCGDFNDTERSPAVRAVLGDGPSELYNPLNGSHEISHPVTHRRIDFLLLSNGMKQAYVPDSEHVMPDPNAAEASDHLPVVARFRIPQ
jgi:endonuclease/exonuclease/phosphatase family metal-dependent hydrolase